MVLSLHKRTTCSLKGKKIKEGKLEAWIQHFLSVLEVTLLKSTQVDFASESWKGARLYHDKDQQKIDIGVENWVQISNQWGSTTSPHQLMAAVAEVTQTRGQEAGLRGGGSKQKVWKEAEKKKLNCTSWNSSEVGGKCKWEDPFPDIPC